MSYKTKLAASDDRWKIKEEFTSKELMDYDPVGLPDEKDLENIKIIMRNHEKVHPGEAQAHAEYNRRLTREAEMNPWGKGHSNADGTRRHTLGMPTCLLRDVQESYPLMFTNRKHLAWFKKNFPMFTVGR